MHGVDDEDANMIVKEQAIMRVDELYDNK